MAKKRVVHSHRSKSMSLDTMMKECLKPHPLLHSVGGLGLGLILAALAPNLASVVIGLMVVVVAVVLEMVMLKK